MPFAGRYLTSLELALWSDAQVEEIVILIFRIEGDGEMVRQVDPRAGEAEIQLDTHPQATLRSVWEVPDRRRRPIGLRLAQLERPRGRLVRMRHHLDAPGTEAAPAFG